MGRLAERTLHPNTQRILLWVVGALGFAILFLLHAAMGKLVTPLHADQAYVVQYANAILGGNWGLRGWEQTTVTFYTEIPLYLLGIKLFGLGPDLMRIVPAFVHTVAILLICILIWRNRTHDRLWIFAPVLLLLLMPSNGIWKYGLFGPMHHATACLGYLVLILIGPGMIGERGIRSSLWIALVSCLATWGDLAYLFVFALPIVLAGVFAYRRDTSSQRRFAIATAAPVLLGSVAGQAVVMAMRAAGFGTPGGLENNVVVSADRFAEKVVATTGGWMEFFFPSFWNQPLGIKVYCALFLAVGLLWWMRAAYWAMFDQKAAALDVLCVTMPITVLALTALTYRQGWVDESRMLVPAYFLGVLLISRWWQAQERPVLNAWMPGMVAVGSVVLSAVFLSQNRLMLAGDAYSAKYIRVAEFLKEKGLTHGYADFWSAHLTMVAGGGSLSLSPVLNPSTSKIGPYLWASKTDWYVGWKANFMLIKGQGERPEEGSPHSQRELLEAAERYWGQPSARYTVEGMVVLVWDEPKSIHQSELPLSLRR